MIIHDYDYDHDECQVGEEHRMRNPVIHHT